MYCRVLACDFDGTGAANAAAELRRELPEDVQGAGADSGAFGAVVAENGAVVWLDQPRRTIQLGIPPSEHFLGEQGAWCPLPRRQGGRGHVAGPCGRGARHGPPACRRSAAHLQSRRAELLPSGVNKATGARCALEELARSERSLLAFGDAENDVPPLALAEVSVAARGAVPAVAAGADERLSLPGPAGVAHYIQRVLEQQDAVPTPPRRRVLLGYDDRGSPALLPGSELNIMVRGARAEHMGSLLTESDTFVGGSR